MKRLLVTLVILFSIQAMGQTQPKPKAPVKSKPRPLPYIHGWPPGWKTPMSK